MKYLYLLVLLLTTTACPGPGVGGGGIDVGGGIDSPGRDEPDTTVDEGEVIEEGISYVSLGIAVDSAAQSFERSLTKALLVMENPRIYYGDQCGELSVYAEWTGLYALSLIDRVIAPQPALLEIPKGKLLCLLQPASDEQYSTFYMEGTLQNGVLYKVEISIFDREWFAFTVDRVGLMLQDRSLQLEISIPVEMLADEIDQIYLNRGARGTLYLDDRDPAADGLRRILAQQTWIQEG